MGADAGSTLAATAATSRGGGVITLFGPALPSAWKMLSHIKVRVSADRNGLGASTRPQAPERDLQWLTEAAADSVVTQSVRAALSTVLRI